jgi:hypothetical protein
MADPILESGFPTFFTFSTVPAIPLYIKSIKPFGLDQGGETDVTTMDAPRDANGKAWRQFAPKMIRRLTNATVTWAYKASAFSNTNLLASLGINQLITLTFPNGATYAIWGYIDKAEPGELSVDENQPTLEGTLVPTLRNTSSVHVAPVYADAP